MRQHDALGLVDVGGDRTVHPWLHYTATDEKIRQHYRRDAVVRVELAGIETDHAVVRGEKHRPVRGADGRVPVHDLVQKSVIDSVIADVFERIFKRDKSFACRGPDPAVLVTDQREGYAVVLQDRIIKGLESVLVSVVAHYSASVRSRPQIAVLVKINAHYLVGRQVAASLLIIVVMSEDRLVLEAIFVYSIGIGGHPEIPVQRLRHSGDINPFEAIHGREGVGDGIIFKHSEGGSDKDLIGGSLEQLVYLIVPLPVVSKAAGVGGDPAGPWLQLEYSRPGAEPDSVVIAADRED